MIRILYIEDDKDDSDTVQQLLWVKFAHIDLTVVETGPAALQFLNDRISMKKALPDMIMLDINLVGMNGIGVFELFRKSRRLKMIPVAVFSSSTDFRDRDYFLNKSLVTYYSKPTTAKEYDVILDDILISCCN